MKLIDVTIHNFGPYYGEHKIIFGDKRPIIVIHGENMRGKTSLLNSIRWVLYGKAVNRFGQKMNLLQLLNLDAAQENDWTMQVILNFKVDETHYNLTRAIQLKKLMIIPTKDSDFDEKLYLKKGNNHLNPDEAQTEINRILPESTSRFFLFDGELLNEYEVLLSQVEKQSIIIKESIERILGVPAITNAISDFKINLKDATNRQQVLAKKDNAAKSYAREADELDQEIDIMEFDLSEVKQQKEEKVIQIKRLNDELQATAGIESDAKRLDDYETRIRSLKDEESDLQEDKRDKLVDAWKELIQPKLELKLSELEELREQQLQQLKSRERITSKLSDIETLLLDGTCPTCRQTVPNLERIHSEALKIDLQNQLISIDYDEEKHDNINQSIRNIKSIGSVSRFEPIRYIENRLKEIIIERVDLEYKIEEIKDRLNNYDISTVIRNRNEYERITKDIGSLETIIQKTEEILNQKKQDVLKLRGKIIQVSGPEMNKANQEVQIYLDLQRLFEKTLVRLRDDLRLIIQNDATMIFKQLITDKTYTGLKINDYFGLTILDINNNPVPERSAGAEQIVALSLIGALNKNAVRQGPIIMDTPFGRLDTKHRENILKFIPTLSTQVTLLVHGGEINKDRDLAMIKHDIEREYEIKFITSRRSEIVLFREI